MKTKYFLIRFSFLFSFLFIITLPFPYLILPKVGQVLSPLFEGLVQFSGPLLFSLDAKSYTALISDSSGLYVHLFNIAIIAVAIGFTWTALWGNRLLPQLSYGLEVLSSYFLSLQLLIYGFNKVFKYQFYFPEPNLLYTRLGELSKDILFWSSMGTSYSYSVFGGLIEILPAVLLLFRKTRVLGTTIALAMLANVVMINIGFDISVKIFSLFLLWLSTLLLVPYLPALARFFKGKPAQLTPQHIPTLSTKGQVLTYAIGKPLVVGLIFFEALFPYFQSGVFNGDKAPRHHLVGSYKVTEFKPSSEGTPVLNIKRFHIHSQGYLIMEFDDGEMIDYKLDFQPSGQLQLTASSSGATVNYQYSWDPKEWLIELKSHYHQIKAKKIDISQLPIYDTDSHWTIDSYKNDSD